MFYTIYIEIKKKAKTNEKLKKKCVGPIRVWLIKIGCPSTNIV